MPVYTALAFAAVLGAMLLSTGRGFPGNPHAPIVHDGGECTFYVKFRVNTDSEASRICDEDYGIMFLDDGTPALPGQVYYGCHRTITSFAVQNLFVDGPRISEIVTNGTNSNIAHEVNHARDYWCQDDSTD